MSQPNTKKESLPSEVRVVVEVDGNPVGFLNFDVGRLWPLISHRKRDHVPVEWMDATEFSSATRAEVVKRLMSRIETHLYRALGDEMVKADLEVESFNLKAEAAAQAFEERKRISTNSLPKPIERPWISTRSFGITFSTSAKSSI